MKRRIVYFLVILSLLLNFVVSYGDGSLSENKQKLNESQQEMKEIKAQEKKLEKEVSNINAEIKKIDAQMAKTDEEIQQLESQLSKLNSDIETTKVELEEANKNIEEKNDTFNSRLKIMYKNGAVGYLEVLFSSSDLSDLLTRIDMISKIVDHDVELMKYMKEQKEIISDKKETLEAKFIDVKATKDRVAIKKNELTVASRSKEVLLSSKQRNLKELEAEFDKLNKEAQALTAIIKRQQSSAKYTGGKMNWPVPNYYRVSSPFGWRVHPIFGTKKMHTGVDIPAPTGTNIVAANGGKVQFAGVSGGYGNIVILDHGGGITTLYAHNSRLLVKTGQTVKKGQAIAKAGSTGYSTGPHLHFEVRRNGKYENPIPWVTSK